MKKKNCWRYCWLDARNHEESQIVKDFDIFYGWKSFWQVEEQIWLDSGQKYIVHEFEEMDGCGAFCEPPLYHGQHEIKQH